MPDALHRLRHGFIIQYTEGVVLKGMQRRDRDVLDQLRPGGSLRGSFCFIVFHHRSPLSTAFALPGAGGLISDAFWLRVSKTDSRFSMAFSALE